MIEIKFKKLLKELVLEVLPEFISIPFFLYKNNLQKYISENNDNDLIQIFIKKVLPYKKRVLQKDDIFFYNIINFLNISEKNKPFINIIISDLKHLDQENKDILWKWFNAFIILSEKYIQQN